MGPDEPVSDISDVINVSSEAEKSFFGVAQTQSRRRDRECSVHSWTFRVRHMADGLREDTSPTS